MPSGYSIKLTIHIIPNWATIEPVKLDHRSLFYDLTFLTVQKNFRASRFIVIFCSNEKFTWGEKRRNEHAVQNEKDIGS